MTPAPVSPLVKKKHHHRHHQNQSSPNPKDDKSPAKVENVTPIEYPAAEVEMSKGDANHQVSQLRQVDIFATPDIVPMDEEDHHGFTDRQREFFAESQVPGQRGGSTTKDQSGSIEIKKSIEGAD